MALVAGIDTSTQSCKVLVVDAASGRVVREGAARHPAGTECPPDAWWTAFREAAKQAGGLDDVSAVSVGGQQHGLVALDSDGAVIRPALLWNDTRSAAAAEELTRELGPEAWAEATGLGVLVASFTITKLRWLADHEPENAARIAAICLPHDWLTWQLMGGGDLSTLVTDRSDASGTGYFDPVSGRYRRDLLARALRRTEAEVADIVLPRVLGPHETAGRLAAAVGSPDALVGPGCGDNAAAALGLERTPGQAIVSVGTSGVVSAVSKTPIRDVSGLVAGFADATDAFLPLIATINGARIIDATAAVLGTDHEGVSALARAAEPGAGGLVFVPHLDGERTPNLPEASGSLVGLTLATMTQQNLARAAVEGLLCLLGVGVEAQRAQGVEIDHITLIGGGARLGVLRELAPAVLGVPVSVPEPGEYVALGAARQAAWVLSSSAAPPEWGRVGTESFEGAPTPWIQQRYDRVAAQLTELVITDDRPS